jgi:hypothetical protein
VPSHPLEGTRWYINFFFWTARSTCIIDEPERHLHRLISAGLVKAIIADRPDAHFVILTHDLKLATALGGENGQIYSLMGCNWEGRRGVGWDLFPVDAPDDIPESARLAILGGRRELLFRVRGAVPRSPQPCKARRGATKTRFILDPGQDRYHDTSAPAPASIGNLAQP